MRNINYGMLTLSKLAVVTVLYHSHFISSITVWNPLSRGGKCALRVTALHHSGTNAVTSDSVSGTIEYITSDVTIGNNPGIAGDSTNKKFFIETHGCQMNLADSEVIRSVLLTEKYIMCDVLEDADLILTNTCSIRENAEMKIYHRLKYFNFLKKKAKKNGTKAAGYPIIGVLGCMAERLKNKLLEEHGVDFIAGPDSYRSLPTLITTATTDQEGGNIVLSLEETYADINPVRLAEGNTHAFVTITRYVRHPSDANINPFFSSKEWNSPTYVLLINRQIYRLIDLSV